MTKYKIYVMIDEQNQFWIVVDNGKFIRSPTTEDLNNAKHRSYNTTNICPICRDEHTITNKSILYPRNACREKSRGQWICFRHWELDYERHNPNSNNNIKKLLADSRTGNLDPNSNKGKGNRFEKLTEIYYEVDNLNIKNNNFEVPIDHSRHHILGIIDTTGRFYDPINRWWIFTDMNRYRNKDIDNIICWCANKNGDIIERGYIIPKGEIINRKGFTIVKNPTNDVLWYEKYRIIDEEELKKINSIWKKIISKVKSS